MENDIRTKIELHEHKVHLFSTPIWGFVLTSEKYHALDYIDFVESLEEEEPSTQKSNFGGWQSRDNLHEEQIMQEFVFNITKQVNIIAQSEKMPRLFMKSMWANINYKNSFNGNHIHDGEISGVFYLQVPKNSGRLMLVNPAVRSHASIFKEHKYAIYPEKLACILFPSWLEHYVEPNMNDEEKRISLSFNFDIEGDV